MKTSIERKIPFFDYPRLYQDNKESLLKIFNEVSSRGSFILQEDLRNFEANLANFSNANFAVGVGNATDALQIALKIGGIRPGDEVIISTHTMIATAGAIIHTGAVPVPVDIGEDHLIDYDSIEKNINSKTTAIMPTQLNGRTCNMDKIKDVAERYNLKVFEDSAQGLGSKFKGTNAGTFGIASAISFYPAKNLGCLGDGGAILINDKDLYDEAISYRDHGRDPNTGDVISWGINSRLDNMQAAFLDYFLKNYHNVIKRRRLIADIYYEYLNNVDEVKLPPIPKNSSDHFDVFQNFEIRAYERDKLKNYLYENGIGTLIQWSGKAIHHHKNLGFNQDLIKADQFFDQILMIPMNMFISDDDVYYICDAIKNFYK